MSRRVYPESMHRNARVSMPVASSVVILWMRLRVTYDKGETSGEQDENRCQCARPGQATRGLEGVRGRVSRVARGSGCQIALIGKTVPIGVLLLDGGIVMKVVDHVVPAEGRELSPGGIEVANQAAVGISALVGELIHVHWITPCTGRDDGQEEDEAKSQQ